MPTMATAVSSLNSISKPPATADVEHMLALNSSVLRKLDAAHQYLADLITEEERTNPVVFLSYMHLLMSIDSMSNEVRIDSRRHAQTLARLKEKTNAKAH
jgi:ubiquinone biosynthesis protein UbiJ